MKYKDIYWKVIVLIPVSSLMLGALAWLKYGIDIPWFDDWRGYMDGNIHSLSPVYLFRAVNDTLAPVGFALDALAQRYLNGNSIAYQLISMLCVLGGIAWLQWVLLMRSLGDKLQASICFFFTIFMMQPDSYWGWENLAYHQALPLIFILTAIYLIIFSEYSLKFIGPLIFTSGIFAGFTYISGAVGVLVCSIVLIGLSVIFFQDKFENILIKKSLWFFSAGILSVLAQIYFALMKSVGTHAGIPLALPSEADFWFFYMGKIGRSLLLPPQWGWISFVITLAICFIALAIAIILLLRLKKKSEITLQEKRFSMIYISLGIVIAVYLAIVSAGRANYRPAEVIDFFEIYSYGFYRFHYFWVTLFWPWVMAGAIMLFRNKKFTYTNEFKWSMVFFGTFIFFICVNSGVFDHFKHNKLVADTREIAANCLLESLQRGPEIRCQGLAPPRNNQNIPDSFPGYLYAYQTEASFVRGFPILSISDFSKNKKIIFNPDIGGQHKNYVNLEKMPNYYKSTSIDPQIEFHMASEIFPKKCIALDIFIEMNLEKDAQAQFFFASNIDNVFSEKNSKTINIESKNKILQYVVFRIESRDGFSGRFRFDPVNNIQEFYFNEIKARCIMVSG